MAFHHRLIGKLAQAYWKVLRPRTLGVRAIVLDQNDRIALVWHTYTDNWYLPGGGVKKGEGFETALFRELKEEVALPSASVIGLVGIYHSQREGKDDHIVIYAVRTNGSDSPDLTVADQMEIQTVRWFSLDDLPDRTSPATERRIAEYRRGEVGSGAW